MTLPELPERFSRLQFPVHKIKAETPGQLFEAIPGLRRYFQRAENFEDTIKYVIPSKSEDEEPKRGTTKGFRAATYGGPAGLVKIIVYICFVYDPESDLIDEYPDEPRLRKEAAAREAGFKRGKDGEFDEMVQRIMNFEDKDVVSWILDYLKVKKSNVWREIVFLEEELDNIYRIRATDFDRAIKNKLDEESKKKIEDLKQFYKQFYSEHHDLRKATEEELVPISPENVFKELKIPEEMYKVRQISDVSQPPGLPEVSN
jgi:hypothetical protein